jgi:hypothetical protein
MYNKGITEMHYMIDTSIKLDKIIDLIERGKYFIINRPRQYGKTTTLYLLDKKLRNMDKYLSIKISFESIDTESYKEAKLFLRSVMKQIKNYFRFSGNKNMYDYFSDRLHFYTSGYPFLVSKLCKIIDEKIMAQDELIWENEYMDKDNHI